MDAIAVSCHLLFYLLCAVLWCRNGTTGLCDWPFFFKERLRSHSQAFDGLLSLIPAKYYYGEDNSVCLYFIYLFFFFFFLYFFIFCSLCEKSECTYLTKNIQDQWQRKKQTKEQAREAKRAKLDPDSSNKTVKDIMMEKEEENAARKRKRDEDDGESSADGDEQREVPLEGLKKSKTTTSEGQKKQKEDGNKNAGAEKKKPDSSEEAEARKKMIEQKKVQKKAVRKEKATAKKEKKNSEKAAPTQPEPSDCSPEEAEEKTDEEKEKGSFSFNNKPNEPTASSSTSMSSENSLSGFDASGSSSSISSVIPAHTAKPDPLKQEELKRRLQKRLDELRAARNADGLNGKPARNRQELIEARRQKADQRKAHKKLLRQKAKEQEQQQKDEAMARRFSSPAGSLLASPRSPPVDNNYAFGRVVFDDGQYVDPALSTLQDKPRKSGPQDAMTALKAAESKKARLAGMDESKRSDIEEKDVWLNAKKRAHGERVHDDTSLLKKALKRKESAKKKSEREWKAREETIVRDREARQAKRDENLRKRREEKGNKGKKKQQQKKKARPGFEGSFKAKVGAKKKK